RQRLAALAMDLLKDRIHALLLGGSPGLLAASALFDPSPPPALEDAFAARADGRRPSLQAGVALGEVVAEDAVVEEAAVVHDPRLDPGEQVDQQGQPEQGEAAVRA